jgi:hypothetical protein
VAVPGGASRARGAEVLRGPRALAGKARARDGASSRLPYRDLNGFPTPTIRMQNRKRPPTLDPRTPSMPEDGINGWRELRGAPGDRTVLRYPPHFDGSDFDYECRARFGLQ